MSHIGDLRYTTRLGDVLSMPLLPQVVPTREAIGLVYHLTRHPSMLCLRPFWIQGKWLDLVHNG